MLYCSFVILFLFALVDCDDEGNNMLVIIIIGLVYCVGCLLYCSVASS
jgi:hypothetical protein